MQKFIASILRCNGIYSPNAAADITELFGNALKGMYFATGVETICECEIPKPFDKYDKQFRHICKFCKSIIITK